MALRAEKVASFRRDFAEQFEWYAREAGADVAWRFQEAVDATILRLLQNQRSDDLVTLSINECKAGVPSR